jgi:hypothetical protein
MNRDPRIRATYTTPAQQFKLDPTFLNNLNNPPKPQSHERSISAHIFVTPDNFTPSLLPSELEKIDNLLARGNGITHANSRRFAG